MTMMIWGLPGDLLEEILCRVPATSLKQVSCTCKRWNKLLNNGRFRRKHVEKAPKQFIVVMLNESRICSMSVNLHAITPSIEVKREFRLIHSHNFRLDPFEISQISHYQGLLLCTIHKKHVAVWNPFTGQTRLIQPCFWHYALGSCQDNKSNHKSYKILSYARCRDFAIYEMNKSNSWRILDITPDCKLGDVEYGVSLKGSTYWFASDEREVKDVFLISFDYTTERFGRRIPLPCQSPCFETLSLSVVREEKIAVLLQREITSRTEIWVTNKIDDTKVVSWSLVLVEDMKPKIDICCGVSFLVDEEKKVVLCCDKHYVNDDEDSGRNTVYIVGEDNRVTEVDFGGVGSPWPFLLDYVPSLTPIQQLVGAGAKRKRDTSLLLVNEIRSS